MVANPDPQNRVFQDATRYHLPNDAPEQERLDTQSPSIVALMNNRPFHAPLTNPKRILDVGCGTGPMTHLLGLAFPSATVIGVDIAPVPQSRHGLLPNVKYIQGDILALIGQHPELQTNSFDYVFSRLLICGMTDWPTFLRATTSLVVPGGWREAQEVSTLPLLPSGKPVREGVEWYYSGLFADTQAAGLDNHIGAALKGYMDAIPDVKNVSESVYPYPVRMEPGKEALAGMVNQLPALFEVVATKVGSARRSAEEMKEMIGVMKRWFEKDAEPGVHFTFYAVIAQRKGD